MSIRTATLINQFENHMNELYPPPVVWGMTCHDSSAIMKHVDPIGYREAFLNWIDAEVRDGRLPESCIDADCDTEYVVFG